MWKTFFMALRTHKKKLCGGLLLLAVGGVYALLVHYTSFRIPCPFHAVTGLACPGCGISHLCLRLLHGDFYGAFRENPAVAILIPLLGLMRLVQLGFHPRWLQKNGKIEKIILLVCIVLLLLFGVVRNLPGMECLLPSYTRAYLVT